MSAIREDGQWLGNTKETKVPIADAMYQVWKTMADEGIITKVCNGAVYKITNIKQQVTHPYNWSLILST